jgi:hypothetical protein
MAAKTPSNGFLKLTNNDTFDTPSPYHVFQPRALEWSGATAAGQHAAIVDINGTTVCWLTASGNGDHVVLDGHYWGESRPWHTPVTATMSAGAIFIVV